MANEDEKKPDQFSPVMITITTTMMISSVYSNSNSLNDRTRGIRLPSSSKRSILRRCVNTKTTVIPIDSAARPSMDDFVKKITFSGCSLIRSKTRRNVSASVNCPRLVSK
ncbi:hypothetical protein DERP_011130 [Dermatophagoides pteronyssinus]|uniref:Uncharacterized protein n=1 Tax=Dermatophagoides pteronyssinus TaxID=6956 RepID=A0ABQ8J9H1_DERPT|nr:hypothetical protein DERP_011130 [Dermatophagoides pteronyssinus]